MSYVYHCGPTNSTAFTTCCNSAVCNYERKCPVCKKHVYPFADEMNDEEKDRLTEHTVGLMRFRYAHKASGRGRKG
jgi:hypothetical protein